MGLSLPAEISTSIPADQATKAERRWSGRRIGPMLVGAVATVFITLTVMGWQYYSASMAVRARSPLHAWLRPSGYVGQSAGVAAFLIFLFLWLYPLRKRFRWLAFTGAVGRWLDVHVATAILMPLIVGLHAGWRFEGLIGLGYAAILVVCASGVIGRYLYGRIPRSRNGVELDLGQVGAERRSLLTAIAAETGLTPREVEERLATASSPGAPEGLARAFLGLLADDVARWRAVRRFCADMKQLDRATVRRVSRLARREAALTQQVRVLTATQRIFRFWHVAHRPFAVTALIAVVAHVVVVVALGATWFW